MERKVHDKNPPKVTGLSPNEGPPGTKITIRGENLGSSPEDLIGLTICGVDCLIYSDWKQPNKILTRSGRCKGYGDIIVTTRSGGRGTCTVQFRGYEEAVSLNKESAVWVNEDELLAGTGVRHRSSSSPTGSQDPLGLCSDDSPKSSSRKLTDSQIRELFGESVIEGDRGSITSDNFIPALYLLNTHGSASFDDLKLGLQSLKKQQRERKQLGSSSSQINLLKPNVLAVVECLDALKSVMMAVKKDRQEYGPDLTYKIEDAIKRETDEAHAIFDDILTRKDLADSQKNALNVLQRYRFLFNLPSSIEKNIQKGDYDLVINDYMRARSLFADTQVKVFRRVYNEVEQRILRFRTDLRDKLDATCRKIDTKNIDELKKLIRHLISLEVSGNPAWESILAMRDTLLESMRSCRNRHIKTLLAKKEAKIVVDGVEGDSPIIDSYAADAPQAVQFIEELTTMFNQAYPDLVRLGQDYLNRDLPGSVIKESDDELKSKAQIFQTETIHKSIYTLVSLMRAALLPQSIKPSTSPAADVWPEDNNDAFVIWLPHCLRCVINCYQSLVKQELIMATNNAAVLQQVQQLIFDFRVNSLVFLFNQASEEVKSLYAKENWDVSLDDGIGTRTNLPLLFESKVIEILQLVRETILHTTSADEVDIFNQINVQGQMKQLAQNLVTAFMVALEKTINNQSSSPSITLKSNPSYEERILIVICNCTFTINYVLPRLHESFDKYNYPDMNMVVKVARTKFRDFEAKLFAQYTERKVDSVIGAIEPSLYLAGQDWYAPLVRPCDVSFYVKETLMNIIDVQSQIFSIAPSLVRKIMVRVIDSSIEEIARLHECVASDFSDAGNLQAAIDFAALRSAFANIENSSTEKLLESSSGHLKPIVASTDKESLDKILSQFRQTMHLQLYCFNYGAEQTVILI